MSLILRANLRQKCHIYFGDTKNLRYSYPCVNYNKNYVKRAVHNDHKYSQEKVSEIYHGILKSKVRNLKIFSLGTTACTIAIQPFFITNCSTLDSIIGIVGSIVFTMFSIFITLLLHIITRRYVTYIYYDSEKDKYLATTYSLFLRENKIEFTPADVALPKINAMITTCFIKGKPLLFDENYFNDYSHYQKIMGFDKPIDYKLSNPNLDNVTIKKDFSEKTK
ncbi:hypothetical protein V1477_009896 [Vespula maculifrons]|uniref:Transmembrane protein 70 homolog, mitochondrial n=1 Tax=Vespula maculifrons TaxID=7453 RepID=A0ABD2CB40_VESMC|nr:transmembrane protein 70 homolog, mitochondrial [Vespula vulgaris]